MIVFTQTDFPDPVAPAIRRCGILREIGDHGPSLQVLAQRDRQAPRGRSETRATRRSSRKTTISAVGVRHLDTHRPLARNRRHDPDARRPHRQREIVGQRRDLPHLDPAAGTISNCVTTGPVVRPTSSPSTRNVRSASSSLAPMASSSRLLTSACCSGGAAPADPIGGSTSPRRRGHDRARSSRIDLDGVRRALRALGAAAGGSASSVATVRSIAGISARRRLQRRSQRPVALPPTVSGYSEPGARRRCVGAPRGPR